MFKVKNNLCPEFIKGLFHQIPSKRKSKASFHRPNVNTVYMGECSLRSFGPIVWDTMVPDKLKDIADLADFKEQISAWVPKNCACRLCKDYVPDLGFVKLFE